MKLSDSSLLLQRNIFGKVTALQTLHKTITIFEDTIAVKEQLKLEEKCILYY